MTGGSGGVGQASARLFTKIAGAKVALISRRGADDLVDEITSAGGVAHSYSADIADRGQLAGVFEKIKEDLGPIRSLLNISGTCDFNDADSTPLDRTAIEDERWDRIIGVNGKGAALAVHFASQSMSKGSSVVNVGSTAGRYGAEVAVIDYTFSKAGLVGLTLGHSKVLAPLGIRVNGVAPGPIEGTEMLSAADDESLAGLKSQIRLGRFCQPEDIANICLFLASDMSSAMTGVTLDANCGQYISY
jgi:3-oxoacyl-[acyl-carrier protein] reductase